MSVNIPASIVALLPFLVKILERIVEKVGFIGKDAIRTQIKHDERRVIKSTFVEARNGAALLDAVETYFEYNKRANEIWALHLSLFVSVIFAAMETTRQALKIEGVYSVGLCIVVGSFAFFVRKFIRSSGAAVDPFPGWGAWTWTMFTVILVMEAAEHVLKD